MNRAQFNQYIKDADFRTLFNELGWDNASKQFNTTIPIDDVDYEMNAVAQKRGFIIYTCAVNSIPQNALCRKIDMRLRRYSNDYIVIFTQNNTQHHLWIAPVKTVEKRDLVTIEYTNVNQADFLFSKLDSISFDLDEEPTIVDVTTRVQCAFEVNSGKITKDFYAGFKKQHNSFVSFIEGIDTDGDRQWYASVMLNRLMFCYFIQKKGFLNFDVDYLRHKFEWTKQKQSEDSFFQSFYKGFLCALFHGGLNYPKHNVEFESVYGRIPYLNGGMFDKHQLEKQYENIDIADEAFERLFEFFDKWCWHLDTRITATGRDINPDVLGYIFEQYINDRAQMGAYYTKEDITEYISKNCIIPFLMDEVAKTTSSKDFKADGFVWQMLKGSGDKYIYNAVKKGCDKPLPDYIEKGINTSEPNLLERRARWNERTSEELALPTEIWRETVERRNRYLDIVAKINSGEIAEINDFITYNLDIRSFAYDLLATTTDHLFVKHFYASLQKVTILDPTCGSGAFLFAALNILEPLYEICIDRMVEFNQSNDNLFSDELHEIQHKYRSNIQHFIYKSIILRNLYGVDIMVEATEIAKLRLFLKMVAVVDVNRRADNLGLDPLPDIDFNIRCGNTLVGYATQKELENDLAGGDMFAVAELRTKIETEMEKVSMAYDTFKQIQLSQQDNIESFKRAKTELQLRLSALNEMINHLMYGTNKAQTYEEWLSSHQPFHWLAEFYQIIQGNGGFDVIIGNPPYVTFTDNSITYNVKKYTTYVSKNLFALVGERCTSISSNNASIGYIIPLSGLSIDGFDSFQSVIYKYGVSWNSFYSGDRNPAELFLGVKIRAGIYISRKPYPIAKFTTKYIKYYSEERAVLFSKVVYEKIEGFVSSPKVQGKIGYNIIKKLSEFKKTAAAEFINQDSIYYHAAPISWCKSLIDIDCLRQRNLNIADSYKCRKVSTLYRDFFFLLYNSSLFFYYWISLSDCYNLTQKYISEVHIPEISNDDNISLSKLASTLYEDMLSNIVEVEYEYAKRGKVRFAQFYPSKSKPIIDEIDKVLAEHYGFTDEELDFIINYDIKYRMGSELDTDTE